MGKQMDKQYVSEFTEFIDGYLKAHPEVVEDQKHGWDIYWNPKMDPAALRKAQEDFVTDDSYGFSLSAWHRDQNIISINRMNEK